MLQSLAPLTAHALTSGPAQPDFGSFEPANTTDMVDPFSGAFTYNLPLLTVPGPNGSGYSISLSYHSGSSIEEEASWVGYGWTLNPGSIARNMKGFPDDASGRKLRLWNKTEPSITVTGRLGANVEIASRDLLSDSIFTDTLVTKWGQIGVNLGLRWNNYKGFSLLTAFGLSAMGVALDYNVDDGDGSFDLSVNPFEMITQSWKHVHEDARRRSEVPPTWQQKCDYWMSRIRSSAWSMGQISLSSLAPDRGGPVVNTPYHGSAFNVDAGIVANPAPLPVGAKLHAAGSFAYQDNEEIQEPAFYGYMYMDRPDDVSDIHDYTTEKLAPYTRRDKFLGIPYSNADVFSVMGQGVGGAFRCILDRAGHFRPNEARSSITIGSIGVAPHAGTLFGPGFTVGYGYQRMTLGGWPAAESQYQFNAEDEDAAAERRVFRFVNDMGGEIDFASSAARAMRAFMQTGGVFPGFRSLEPTISGTAVSPVKNDSARTGCSSSVGYRTFGEMNQTSDVIVGATQRRAIPYNSMTKSTSVRSFVDRNANDTILRDQIAEFFVTGVDGGRYVYGLPVFARNEKNLSVGLEDLRYQDLDSMHIAYRRLSAENATIVVGEERPEPYVTTWLLTQVTTPDYIDRTHDGPTSDDAGGYTRFEYRRTAGTATKTASAGGAAWFRWRYPYSGLAYDRNQLAVPGDDMGTVSMGDREVYYLASIETKTHVAYFITNKTDTTIGGVHLSGSGVERKDGFEAVHDELAAAGSRTATTASGANKMEYLERIELWSKDSSGNPGRLLQRTHFRYNYDLCRNLPNAAYAGSGTRYGKLTLEKIWHEFEGTVQPRVSPWVFGYQYRDSSFYASDVRERFPDITSYASALSSAEQNPDYSPFNTDRWGNYQTGGGARHLALNPYIDQTPDESAFDPAAWQLKWIRLPSGGEIHIQYEANRYRFVQDRPAMAMVSLVDDDDNASNAASQVYFYANVEDDLGVTSDQDLVALRAMARKEFMTDANRHNIAFRFLYALKEGHQPAPDDCASDYITGYVNVLAIDTATRGGTRCLKFTVGDGNPDHYATPLDVLRDHIHKNRTRDLGDGMVCENRGVESVMRPGRELDAVRTLAQSIGRRIHDASGLSARLDFSHSYLRIPMTHDKLGGGVRVRRLLMCDPGMRSGEEALYGSEYVYVNDDGTGSGVATNEPARGREENALVTDIERRSDKSGLQRIVSGKDLEQFEGPIGENILPSPTVGYERVVVKSIHAGPTAPGFSVREYHTVRTCPFDGHFPAVDTNTRGVDRTDLDKEQDVVDIKGYYFNYNVDDQFATQGYRFIQTGMSGQPKGVRTYGGDYDDPSTWSLSSSQEYDYFAPGEDVPMFTGINITQPGSPGKETEVLFEGRSMDEETINGALEVDPDFAIGFPLPFYFSMSPKVSISHTTVKTHVTTKIVRYPAIVRSVTTFADGVYSRTENVAFDPKSGQPVVTRRIDGFDGLSLAGGAPHIGEWRSYTLPAWRSYGTMDQKATNERVKIISGSSNPFTIERRIISPTEVYLNVHGNQAGVTAQLGTLFSSGDLIRVTKTVSGTTVVLGIYHVRGVNGVRIELAPVAFNYPVTEASEPVDVEVLQSGRTNQLGLAAASIVTYGSPNTPTLCPEQ